MADDRTLRFAVNGEPHAVNPDEISRNLALECLRETGLSPEQALAGMLTNPGKVTLSAAVWLSRRSAGDPSFRKNGRVTTRLIDEIYEAMSSFDDSIELIDATTPAPTEVVSPET